MSDTLDRAALETAHAAAMYEAGAHIHEDAIAAGIAAYLAAAPQPANPAQVTDAEIRRYIDKCNELATNGEHTWWSRLAEILAAIGAGGQAVACKECDGTGFKDKNGARLTLARTPCGACAGSGYVATLSQPHPASSAQAEFDRILTESDTGLGRVINSVGQPHPADERVVEALRKIEYCLTKDSLCEAEKIDDALMSVRRLIAAQEGRS